MIPLPIGYQELDDIYQAAYSRNINTLAITGIQGREGVSTLAYAIARRAAAAGQKTLLVDFNHFCPSVGKRLALQCQSWDIKNGNCLPAVIPVGRTQLSILPAPDEQINTWDVRDQMNLVNLFESWHDHFDLVVVDTPPLLRRNQLDTPSATICGACDATIVNIMTGVSQETQVQEAQKRLSLSGAKVLGCVMNDRYAPSLVDELCRETHRLDRFFPKIMERLRAGLKRNAFLNQPL